MIGRRKARRIAHYLMRVALSAGSLLLESGDGLLLESGDALLKE